MHFFKPFHGLFISPYYIFASAFFITPHPISYHITYHPFTTPMNSFRIRYHCGCSALSQRSRHDLLNEKGFVTTVCLKRTRPSSVSPVKCLTWVTRPKYSLSSASNGRPIYSVPSSCLNYYLHLYAIYQCGLPGPRGIFTNSASMPTYLPRYLTT
ncbi:hypothetical protein F4781DRAFT_62103 [Annulohypoxylon bovei var. microspora]|nr:hypothetical protein F4781DRAFT_62103 [Annulohypoxylon bovei var. microspora]